LCPAIVEPDGEFKDRVQVNGRTEVHSEGVYYIEWRKDQSAATAIHRQPQPSSRNLVLQYARLKALELELLADESKAPALWKLLKSP
jgi:hypothetical protein